ncbi:phage portal protein family protein, partial [Achromobacter xylosoxidans]
HLFSVMQTRRLTVSQLDWSIEPPANATSAEQDEAAFVTEVLQGLEMEDILFDMTDAVGHGFSPIELGWDTIEKTRMPVTATFRPQGWFRTPISPGLDRNELRLRDNSADGESLWPFGWIMHTHRSRSGYI